MKYSIKKVYGVIACLLICTTSFIASYDWPHFYRAAYFPGQPRLAKEQLSSFDVTFAAGAADRSRNCNGDTTCLFDIFGATNMQKLGAGVPCKDPTNPADMALIYLAQQPANGSFAHLSFGGKFHLAELIFSIPHNFMYGFYGQLLVPVRHMAVRDICFNDLSPCNSACAVNNPVWNMFLNLLPDIFERYGLCMRDYSETRAGDISVLFGWAINYQETVVLDYIDMGIRTGVIIPTSKEQQSELIFDIPFGYDGHLGIPIMVDASIGLFDWFTAGVYGNYILFFDKTHEVRMKTDPGQCGFLRLAKGCALVSKGDIFDVGGYVLADHFAKGLSLLIGYTYSKKFKDTLTPKNDCIFDPCIVNTDPTRFEWDMHTMHFGLEFDLAHEGNRFSPRIGLFYNWQVAGKRVFKTNMVGATVGFDFALKF